MNHRTTSVSKRQIFKNGTKAIKSNPEYDHEQTKTIETLPKPLKYWINSIPKKSCALLNEIKELADGKCIYEIIEHIFNSGNGNLVPPMDDRDSPAGRIRSAICTIANHLGWSALPLEFTDINFTYRLIKGDNNIIMIMFLDYLQALYVYYSNILKSNPDPIQLESGVSYSNILKHRQDQQSYTTVGISELEESYLLNTVQDASPSTTLRNISNTRGGLNQHEEQQSTKQQSLHIANNQATSKIINNVQKRKTIPNKVHTNTSTLISSDRQTINFNAKKIVPTKPLPSRTTTSLETDPLPVLTQSDLNYIKQQMHSNNNSRLQNPSANSKLNISPQRANINSVIKKHTTVPITKSSSVISTSTGLPGTGTLLLNNSSIIDPYYIPRKQHIAITSSQATPITTIPLQIPKRNKYDNSNPVPSAIEQQPIVDDTTISWTASQNRHVHCIIPSKQSLIDQMDNRSYGVNSLVGKNILKVFLPMLEEDNLKKPPLKSIHDVITTHQKNEVLNWIQNHLGIVLSPIIFSPTSIKATKKYSTKLKADTTIEVANVDDSTNIDDRKKEFSTDNLYKYRPQYEIDSEKYRYTSGNSMDYHGTNSIASYLGDITCHIPDYLGHIAGKVIDRQNPPQSTMTKQGFFNDPWVNGILLSEVVAALSWWSGSKQLVKQVDCHDRFANTSRSHKLLLCGCETNVKSKAQAIHNMQLSIDLLSQIPGFPAIDFGADDIFNGKISLWYLLFLIYQSFHNSYGIIKPKNSTSALRGRSHNNNSQSPKRRTSSSYSPQFRGRRESRGISINPKDQTMTIPLSEEEMKYRPSSGRSSSAPPDTDRRVGINIPRTANEIPIPSSKPTHPRRLIEGGKENVVPTINRQNVIPSNEVPSSSSGYASSQYYKSNTIANQIRNRNGIQNNVSPPRFNSEAQRILADNATNVAQTRANEMQQERAKSRLKERNNRNILLQQWQEWKGNKLNIEDKNTSENRGTSSTGIVGDHARGDMMNNYLRTNREAREKKMELLWFPPKIPTSDIAAAKNTPIPEITKSQQSSIRTWLLTLDISLVDGEGGYVFESTTASRPYDGGNSSSSTLRTILTTPLLPLHQDRLRNGELFGRLLCLLESDIAIHANIPRLMLHTAAISSKKISIEQFVANMERVFWLFKLHKCPPIPYFYLCQPQQFMEGNKNIIWGLLWEIMQAYGNAPLKYPMRNVNDKTEIQPLNAFETVSTNHALEIHDLPYSAPERRQLDISLMNWLRECGLLKEIIGDLNNPVTILSLESYLKDGTLFCLLIERLFPNICLSRSSSFVSGWCWNRNPHTYNLCIMNIRNCINALKTCHRMRTRFLYEGVAEDIVRGKWDSILGLLEDMHRYVDGLSPSEHIFKVVNRMAPNGTIQLVETQIPYLGKFPSTATMINKHGSTLSEELAQQSNELYPNIQPTEIYLQPPPPPPLIPDNQKVRAKQQSSLLHDTMDNSFNPTPNLTQSMEQTTSKRRNSKLVDLRDDITKTDNYIDDITKADDVTKTNRTTVIMDKSGFTGSDDLFPSNQISGVNLVEKVSKLVDDQFISNQSHYEDRDLAYLDPALNYTGLALPSRNTEIMLESESVHDSMSIRGGEGGFTMNNKNTSSLRPTHSSINDKVANIDNATVIAPPTMRNIRNSNDTSNEYENDSLDPNDYSPAAPAISAREPSAQNHKYDPSRALAIPAASTYDQDSTAVASINNVNNKEIEDIRKEIPGKLKYSKIKNDPVTMSVIKQKKLKQWIQSLSISIPEHIPRNNNDDNCATTSNSIFPSDCFSDGLILCKLVQKLERIHQLPGIYMNPINTTQRVQNIRRALEYLAANNKRIPLRILSCEEDILYQEHARVLELLYYMKNIYT